MIIEETKHRMTRRRNGWDYCAPGCSYMITLTMTPASRDGREPPGIVLASLLAGSSLWSPGLTDSILWSRERHSRAAAYIADNPRRLAERRANPRLFTVRRDFAVSLPLGDGGSDVVAHFSAIGNDGLLKRLDFHQVQCSRRFFEYSRDKYGKPLKNAPPAVETAEFRARLEDALVDEDARTAVMSGVPRPV